jgi:hypothetical protein
MKALIYLILILLFLTSNQNSFAQSPQGKNFGFGIMLGDPTGGTAKFWTSRQNAFTLSLGKSYFGSPRIGVDYLWHFNSLNTNTANLYAGVGGAIGFGEGKGFWYKDKYFRTKDEAGVGARGSFGVNFIPRETPLELFFELGVLMSFTPDFDTGADAALGIRFYR